MTGIHFSEPVFLYLLVFPAVLFVISLLAFAAIRISRLKPTFGSKYPFIGKIKLWGIFVVTAAGLMIAALAKPISDSGGFKAARGNADVVIVIDRSLSMRADDVKPTRLEIAKREALNISGFLESGDRVAFYVFGSEAHRKIRLSKDYEDVFAEQISDVGFSEQKYLMSDGTIWDTDFATMLEKVYQSLDRQDKYAEGLSDEKKYTPKKSSNRIVIILTDGEDQLKNDKTLDPDNKPVSIAYDKRLNGALAEFRKRGLKIYPVGIGTVKGVSWLSLLKGYKEGTDYPKDLAQDWKGQISKLDAKNLLYLSKSTGVELTGERWTVTNDTDTAKVYLKNAVNSNRSSVLEFSSTDDNEPMWQYFVMAAVLAIGFGILTYPVNGYFRKKKN